MVFRYTWPAIIWSIIVLFLTLLPGEDFPDVPIFGIDKVVHFFIFGLLMILTSFGLYKSFKRKNSIQNPIIISFVYSVSFSIAIELLQQFVPGRSPSVFDVVANVIGVALGYFVFTFWKSRQETRV